MPDQRLRKTLRKMEEPMVIVGGFVYERLGPKAVINTNSDDATHN